MNDSLNLPRCLCLSELSIMVHELADEVGTSLWSLAVSTASAQLNDRREIGCMQNMARKHKNKANKATMTLKVMPTVTPGEMSLRCERSVLWLSTHHLCHSALVHGQ